jgi:hypothetical protein
MPGASTVLEPAFSAGNAENGGIESHGPAHRNAP